MSVRPLALLLLAACHLSTYDSSTSATAATTDTTSGSTTAPPTSTTSTTDTEPGSTSCSLLDCTPDHPPPDCDIWTEDCPEGQKCTPYSSDGDLSWDSLKCVPIHPNPDQPGEPCTVEGSGVSGIDSCDKHAMCWNVNLETGMGERVPFCLGPSGEPSCADPLDGCIAKDGAVLPLCLPHCDPIAQNCDPDESCIPAPLNRDTFACILALAAYGESFQPCDTSYHCNPGLACLDPSAAIECDPMASGCCLPFCDLDDPNTCPGQGQQCIPLVHRPERRRPLQHRRRRLRPPDALTLRTCLIRLSRACERPGAAAARATLRRAPLRTPAPARPTSPSRAAAPVSKTIPQPAAMSRYSRPFANPAATVRVSPQRPPRRVSGRGSRMSLRSPRRAAAAPRSWYPWVPCSPA